MLLIRVLATLEDIQTLVQWSYDNLLMLRICHMIYMITSWQHETNPQGSNACHP